MHIIRVEMTVEWGVKSWFHTVAAYFVNAECNLPWNCWNACNNICFSWKTKNIRIDDQMCVYGQWKKLFKWWSRPVGYAFVQPRSEATDLLKQIQLVVRVEWNKVYTIKQKRKINKYINLLCNNYCFFISWNELLSTGICLTKLVYTVDLCWSHKNFYFVFSFLLRILLWLLQEGLGPSLYKNMSRTNLDLSSPKICTPKFNFWLLPTMSSSMN